MSKKYIDSVPWVPLGPSVFGLHAFFWIAGSFYVWALNRLNVNERILSFLDSHLTQTATLTAAQACYLLSTFSIYLAILYGYNSVIRKRVELKIPHPLHHVSEKDVVNKSDRMTWIGTLRGLENFLENLAPFLFDLSLVFAVCNQAGFGLFTTIAWTLGRILYMFGYQQSAEGRLTGLCLFFIAQYGLRAQMAYTLLFSFGKQKTPTHQRKVKSLSMPYETNIPVPPGGPSVYFFHSIMWLCGALYAYGCTRLGVNGVVLSFLDARLTPSAPLTSMQVCYVLSSFVVYLAYIHAYNLVMLKRQELGVPHPIHHPTEKDVKDKSTRLAYIAVSRCLENLQDNMAPFFFDLALFFSITGQAGMGFFSALLWSIARLVYTLGYARSAMGRLPGLLSFFMVHYGLRAYLMISVIQSFGFLTFIKF